MEKKMKEVMKEVNYIDNFQHEIVEYVRDSSGKPIGVLRAFSFENSVFIGFSKCNEKAGDVFDKDFGIKKAKYNALRLHSKSTKIIESNQLIPFSIREQLKTFILRCKKYFQNPKYQNNNKSLPEWAENFIP